MAFEKKIWTDRVAEFINRRQLTYSDGSTELVTVSREEGTVSEEGDAFSAENMNDLEKRIKTEFDIVRGDAENYYKLNGLIRIPDGTDVHTLTDFKNYYCGDAEHAKTLVNPPVTNSGFSYRTERINGGSKEMRAIAITTGGIEYYAVYRNDTWTEWSTDLPYEDASGDVVGTGENVRKSDCNDYLATSFPYIRMAWISGLTANSPFGAMYNNSGNVTGVYENFESRKGLLVAFRRVQIVFAYTEMAIYTRMYVGSTWTEWQAFNGSKYNDSGWIDVAGQLSMSSPFANYSSYQALKFRRIGNVVSICGGLRVMETIPASQSATEIFTLPKEYRPSAIVNSVNNGSGMNRFVLSVNPDTGVVGVARYGTTEMIDIPEGAYLKCDLTFFVD